MRKYLCDTDGTGGHLKTEPEDFVVTEISDPPRRKEIGDYTVATVTCRNWETNRLVKMMARELGVSREAIGFAGTKDKRAVTKQLMSFHCKEGDLDKIHLTDVTIEDPYRASRAIMIGDLIGNEFTIKVRDCSVPASDLRSIIDENVDIIKRVGGFPNYFGVQRFGVVRPVTHLVGERLVRGDIEGAVRTYICFTTPEEDEETASVRKALEGCTDWKEALKMMPPSMSFEKTLAGSLMENPDDWAGAISMLPKNLQMMFVHAYQSYLFNEMLSLRMDRGLPLNEAVVGDIIIPTEANGIPDHDKLIRVTEKNIDLVARQIRAKRAFVTIALFGTDGILADGEMGEIERKVVEENNLVPQDFIIPKLNQCNSAGGRREILCPLKGIRAEVDDEGYTLDFSLPKGNYATCLLREFMKSEMRDYRSDHQAQYFPRLVHAEIACGHHIVYGHPLGEAHRKRR
jgi:tRNA pseudouridine13 synthase